MERVETQLAYEEFRPIELQVPPSRLEFVEGFPFEFELGKRMVQELGSIAKGSIDPTTQTNTPKSMEEVATEVMKVNKVAELFQTMVIVSFNMGNLALEVNTLKIRLVTGEQEKAVLQEELDKEREFRKGYKHNVEIQRKNRA